jgi:hypothetical protein
MSNMIRRFCQVLWPLIKDIFTLFYCTCCFTRYLAKIYPEKVQELRPNLVKTPVLENMNATLERNSTQCVAGLQKPSGNNFGADSFFFFHSACVIILRLN